METDGASETVVGDSFCSTTVGPCTVMGNGGNGGNDWIDLGSDGAVIAVGDNLTGLGDVSTAGDGNAIILGGTADEVLLGDNVDAQQSAFVLAGGAGNDVLFGRAGDDILFGQGGSDKLDGAPNTDFCDGGNGTDTAKACGQLLGIP